MGDMDERVKEIRRWHDDLVSRGGCYPCDQGRCPAPSLLAAYDYQVERARGMQVNLGALEKKMREAEAGYKKLVRDLRRQRDRLLKRIEKLEGVSKVHCSHPECEGRLNCCFDRARTPERRA